MQWIVLCGIPYRGSGALASPDPANTITLASHFPQSGQALWVPGGFTAHLQLFKSITCFSHLQVVSAFSASDLVATF
jgi:hypothetical protein